MTKQNPNKNLLAAKSLFFGLRVLFTSPIRSIAELWDWVITPLANEEIARGKQKFLPNELANAYNRDWNFTTLSDIRKLAGQKGGQANSKQN